jgi:hypothetical protein
MVAYSFKKQFVPAIQSGRKRQTIRALRRRHARPGEMLQLYCGMRTATCVKIVPDARCIGVDDVRFDLASMADAEVPATYAEMRKMIDDRAFHLSINGIPLARADFDRFASDDGFEATLFDGDPAQPVSPFDNMLLFWMWSYGAAVFNGVLIRWESV